MNRAGTETMLMNLFRAVDRSRIMFDFAVSATEKCDYDEEIMALGGRIIHYPKYTGKNHFAYIRWWNHFYEMHPEYRIIHGHIGSTAYIYLKSAKKHGRYTIAHSHSAGTKPSFHGFLYWSLAHRTKYVADYCFGCSTPALIRRYGKKVAADRTRSCLLNNGVDVSKYKFNGQIREEVRKEFDIREGTLVVGTVGRFTDQKNPYFIVDMLRKLKERDSGFVFLWAGTGEEWNNVRDSIHHYNLENHVKLLGVRNDIPRLLQVLNVFVLPSKYEGLPVIGVEVQAAGIPMLCSSQVSSEVKLSSCVTFLPIDSVEQWVEGMLKEKTFRRIDEASNEVVQNGYDILTTSKWLVEFYERHW